MGQIQDFFPTLCGPGIYFLSQTLHLWEAHLTCLCTKRRNASVQCGQHLVYGLFLIPISRDGNPLCCSKGLLLAAADTADGQRLVPGYLLCSALQPEKELTSPPTETTLPLTSALIVPVTEMMLS